MQGNCSAMATSLVSHHCFPFHWTAQWRTDSRGPLILAPCFSSPVESSSLSVSGPSCFLLGNNIWQEWGNFAHELRSQSSWFWVNQGVYPRLDVISWKPGKEELGPPWWAGSFLASLRKYSPVKCFLHFTTFSLFFYLPDHISFSFTGYSLSSLLPLNVDAFQIAPFFTLTPWVPSSSALALNTIYMCMILKWMPSALTSSLNSIIPHPTASSCLKGTSGSACPKLKSLLLALLYPQRWERCLEHSGHSVLLSKKNEGGGKERKKLWGRAMHAEERLRQFLGSMWTRTWASSCLQIWRSTRSKWSRKSKTCRGRLPRQKKGTGQLSNVFDYTEKYNTFGRELGKWIKDSFRENQTIKENSSPNHSRENRR